MKRISIFAILLLAGLLVACGGVAIGPTSEQATQTAIAAVPTTVAPPPTVVLPTEIPTTVPSETPTVTLIPTQEATVDPAVLTASPQPATTDSGTTGADATAAPPPTATVFATPTSSAALNNLAVSDPSKNAVIAGTIFIPNRSLAPAMLIFAHEPVEGWYHFIETLPGTTVYSMEVGVHPNPYLVYAYPLDGTKAGAYTQAAKCGVNPTVCTDHRILPILLTPGEIRKDVNIWDWESGAIAIPPAPVPVPVKDYSYLTPQTAPTVVGTTTTIPQTLQTSVTPSQSNTPDPNATATATPTPTATVDLGATATALAGNTPVAGASPTLSKDTLEEGKGRMVGAISYPAGVSEVVVYAVRADSKYSYFIPNPNSAGFQLDVEPGKWVIYAYPRGAETGNLAGGYTAGGTTLASVTVEAGVTYTGINIGNWAQNTYPPAPFVPPAGQQ
ncbi:MAG TPA: hypothetical protein PK299_07400 [Anaerolineales bacterium]|nr:hypothetical protein [Anaerolineales bacterium]